MQAEEEGTAVPSGLAAELAARSKQLRAPTREEREAQETVEAAPDIFQGLVSALSNIRRGMAGKNVGKDGTQSGIETDGEDSW